MEAMEFSLLPTRSVLRLHGEETLAFLQGLVTNDVMRLEKEGAQYAALLTPQGKFLHGFFLVWDAGAVLLDVGARAEDLLQRLKMYRLRSKVAMEMTPLKVAACWGEAGLPALPAALRGFADPRFAGMGYRIIGEEAALAAWGAGFSAGDYEAMRLGHGMIDESRDVRPEKHFPLHFGFEALHGVDFRKGCYVGQEVTARTKHLGRIGKAVYRVQGSPLPASGTLLEVAGKTAGEMLSGAGNIGIALLDMALVAEAGGTVSYAGGALSVSVPSWSSQGLES